MKTTKARRLALARHVANTDSAGKRATSLTIMASGVGVTMMSGEDGRDGRGDGSVSVRRREGIVMLMLWRDGGGRGRDLKRKSHLLHHRLKSGIANEIGMDIVGAGILRTRGVRRRM
jgi:hypothetical protein